MRNVLMNVLALVLLTIFVLMAIFVAVGCYVMISPALSAVLGG